VFVSQYVVELVRIGRLHVELSKITKIARVRNECTSTILGEPLAKSKNASHKVTAGIQFNVGEYTRVES